MKFSDRLGLFGDEIFAALDEKKSALQAQGKTIYNFSIGTPDFETPQYIMEVLRDAAMDSANWKYALHDTPELLQAVCDYYKDRFDVEITPDMICSCYGSQEGMGHLGLVFCNKGDTVILPDPCYPVFIAGAKMAEAEPYFYHMTAETGFLPDVSQIPEDVARKAKYMIVSLPSNPLGSVGNEENYKEIIAFARKYDIVVVHDNAYSDIIFDGVKGGSFLKYEGAKEIGVEFFSLSKSFNVTGARISFLIGNKEVVDAFRKLRSQIDFGMFLPIQKVATAVLKGPRQQVLKQCGDYEERRNALCSGLREIGWNVNDSHGSMFVWAPIPEGYSTSTEFCLDLMERSGVICTPGSSFGPGGEGYVRFALIHTPENIKIALRAIDECGILKK